jgi:hypothetical protein
VRRFRFFRIPEYWGDQKAREPPIVCVVIGPSGEYNLMTHESVLLSLS